MVLPDLESIRCFVAAARSLNFRRAAQTVALSPAALGERIRRLEDELGAELFVRTTRKVSLTEPGNRLLQLAEPLLENARRLGTAIHDQGLGIKTELRLGTRYELGMSWIVPSLDRIQGDERMLHLYFGDSDDLLSRLFSGRIDAFISSARLAVPSLEYAPLHEEKYVFAASKGLLKNQPLSKPEHAQDHTLLDIHEDLPLFRYFVDGTTDGSRWEFGDVNYLGTIGAVRARLLAGRGVAVLPEYFVREDIAKGRIVRLFPRQKLPIDYFRLIWKRSSPHAEALARLAVDLSAIPLR